MKERLALFFDGANHSKALSKSGVDMNFGPLLQNLRKTYDVESARYYSGISDEDEHRNIREFLKGLSSKGYDVITKPVKKFPDGTIKGNVDVEIAVDMVSMAPRLDRVILFSGDGDFAYLVRTVQGMGVYVTVCSHSTFTAMDLKTQANEFLELRDLVRRHQH